MWSQVVALDANPLIHILTLLTTTSKLDLYGEELSAKELETDILDLNIGSYIFLSL